ncbi:hypothetical protein EDD16DRAFT_685467 [Pisolithus croceorrhizus]|nr:hypothetical protein EDD16DRAFT_685467 [Pisolithus croceorrhizus]KAI6125307.1 hypothetical protein EV401DRAFT_1117370 [Pisolithus croceorrhizus]
MQGLVLRGSGEALSNLVLFDGNPRAAWYDPHPRNRFQSSLCYTAILFLRIYCIHIVNGLYPGSVVPWIDLVASLDISSCHFLCMTLQSTYGVYGHQKRILLFFLPPFPSLFIALVSRFHIGSLVASNVTSAIITIDSIVKQVVYQNKTTYSSYQKKIRCHRQHVLLAYR